MAPEPYFGMTWTEGYEMQRDAQVCRFYQSAMSSSCKDFSRFFSSRSIVAMDTIEIEYSCCYTNDATTMRRRRYTTIMSLDPCPASAIENLVSGHGQMNKSRELFDRITDLSVLLWITMTTGYAQSKSLLTLIVTGLLEEGRECFLLMQAEQEKPASR